MEKQINAFLDKELNEVKQRIILNMDNEGITTTGTMAESLEVVTTYDSGEIRTHKYFRQATETGRGPARGGNNSGGDFLQNLRDWIVAKNIAITSDAQLERLAGFLKWHINKFGSKLWRDGGRKTIYTPELEKFENEFPAKVADIYLTEVSKEIDKAI